jgi:hypothetical protein
MNDLWLFAALHFTEQFAMKVQRFPGFTDREVGQSLRS